MSLQYSNNELSLFSVGVSPSASYGSAGSYGSLYSPTTCPEGLSLYTGSPEYNHQVLYILIVFCCCSLFDIYFLQTVGEPSWSPQGCHSSPTAPAYMQYQSPSEFMEQDATSGTVHGPATSSAADAVETGRRALFEKLCKTVQAARNEYIMGLHNLEFPYAVANYPYSLK